MNKQILEEFKSLIEFTNLLEKANTSLWNLERGANFGREDIELRKSILILRDKLIEKNIEVQKKINLIQST